MNTINHIKNKEYIKIILLLIISIILIIDLLNFSLNGDENFTIGMIHNTYSNIISLDSLDVHPPLYYLLLKLFLQMTTFWTNNILIKIFCARLFSLLISFNCIYFGFKILECVNIIHIKQIVVYICIIFLAIPSIFLYSLYIRMYALASMFLFMELYELIKYVKMHQNINLFLALLMGSLAAYTHYFAAISAGLFLLYFFAKFIHKKDLKNSLKLAISGIIYLIIYAPWLVIAKRQFSMATSNQYNTNQIYTKSTYTITNLVHLFKQTILSLVGGQGTYGTNKSVNVLSVCLLILFIYLVHWSFKNLSRLFNSLLITSIINLLGTVLVGLLVSIIKHPILIDHYLFPSFAIFAFFMSYVIYQYIKRISYSDKLHVSLSWLIILVLFMNVASYARYSDKNLLKSYNVITEMNVWQHSVRYGVYKRNTKNNIWNIAGESIYLRSLHKDINTNSYKNTEIMFGKPNVNLMHGIYPNIKKSHH